MLSSVFAKTLRDHWRGWFIAWVCMVILLLMVMAIYREVDLDLYQQLPQAYKSMLGVPETADVASLSVRTMLGTYGALVLASMTLAFGAGMIAREEAKGTIGLLLANPKSRTHIVASKIAGLVVLAAVCVVALWGSIVASAAWLDVSIEGMDIGAQTLHLLAYILFYGLLAGAIGTWTGRRGPALGVSIALLTFSFVGVGIFPLLENGDNYLPFVPAHYFTGSEPLLNGIDWGDMGVMIAACVILAGIVLLGVNRRDLRSQSTGVTLLDRLRANPMTEKVIGRLAGTARVSSIWVKTASEYQPHLIITSVYMFWVQGFMMGPLYSAFPENVRGAADDAFAAMPKAFLALFGGGSMGTPEGFYRLETFGMVVPAAIMVVAIAIGAGALAGEESKRTMGLLLANPIPRSRVIIAKTVTLVLYSAVVGVVTFAGVAAGAILGDLGMSIGNIAAACALGTLVGIVFGALALAISAGTGRKQLAIWGSVGAALCLHLFNSMEEVTDKIADWTWLSPFHYYIGNGDPLVDGMNWGNAAVLVVVAAALIGASFYLFQRRDLRQGS